MKVGNHVVPLHRKDLRTYMKDALVAVGLREDVARSISADVLEKFMEQFLIQLKLRGNARLRGWLSVTKRANSEKTFTLKITIPGEENNGGCELDDFTES